MLFLIQSYSSKNPLRSSYLCGLVARWLDKLMRFISIDFKVGSEHVPKFHHRRDRKTAELPILENSERYD